MSQCTVKNCNLDALESEKCILHCKKHEYSEDFHKVGFLKSFFDELLNLIIESLYDNTYSKEALRAYFTNDRTEDENALIRSHFMNDLIVFTNIFFPQSKDLDSFDYKKLFRKLTKIQFNYCEFSTKYIDLNNTECFFQNCKFHNGLILYDLDILDNESNVLFQECVFKDEVISFSEEKKITINASLFANCLFTDIKFEDTIFKKPIFNNFKGRQGQFDSLSIRNSIIEDRFILHNHILENMTIHDTIFHDKFELKKSSVNELSIINSNFKGLVDCFNSNFKEFYIHKSIFEDFVGFEYCHFGEYEKECGNCTTKFEYATFLSFINMRNTYFISGLDMRDANLKEYPNFLGTFINEKNTNKETFRIVKYSFDKVGNTSEANKYFSYEMAKERKEVHFWENPEKKIMLTINHWISNFGQSYLLPLMWIFFLMIIHKLSVDWMNTHSIIDYFPKYGYVIEYSIDWLNSLVKNLTPLKRFLHEGIEFISLLFYIMYSVLIYHFIVAAKRLTKR